MMRVLLIVAVSLSVFAASALAASEQPATYHCYIYTRLPGAAESPVFRFTVDGEQASLTYSFRLRPSDEPQHKHIELEVLNNSARSLVMGFLTEGTEENAPRYDVWVLDKNNMALSTETTRASDAYVGIRDQRSGVCIAQEQSSVSE